MTDNIIEIKGLEEITQRMQRFPNEFSKVADVTMDASLLTLWENVPPYPAPPPDSSYDRTGTHGRKLGSDVGGGKSGGTPSIYTKKKLSSGFEGRFGTNLEYSQYVIGDTTQAWMHYRWYRMKDIANAARGKIISLWNIASEKMARFLDGKGM
jgi:hypothetical protein